MAQAVKETLMFVPSLEYLPLHFPPFFINCVYYIFHREDLKASCIMMAKI